MDTEIYVKTYDAPQINKKEILRYMGAKELSKEIDGILSECLEEINNQISYKVCYSFFEISLKENYVDLGFFKVFSKDLSKNLRNCKKGIIFAATIGVGIDRLIIKYSKTSPLKALMFQAIGAERIESLCNVFNNEINKNNYTVPRFSAGYGDLPIEFQKEIFKVLTPEKKIGLTLNESLVMSPSKSVTAVIGISDLPCEKKEGCSMCANKNCLFRREK